MIIANLEMLSPMPERGIRNHGASDFSSLWETAEERARVFLRASVFSEEDRKDILQAVAQKAILSFHTFSPGKGSFSAWILGIARNEYLHYVRSRRRACVLFDSQLADRAVSLLSCTDEAESFSVQRTRALQREIDRLPAEQRNLLGLKYSENLTCAQIAALLCLSENAVKMRLSRIRAHLKRRLLPFDRCGK